MDTVTISNLSKTYGAAKAVDNASFAIKTGCITGFIGQNGAGKTTTIKMILGLATPDHGEIRIFGQPLNENERNIKDRIGVVFDQGYLYEDLNAMEMQGVLAPTYSMWDKGVFASYISRFSLPRDKRVKELSKGMKMKLALALALSHNADFLIMDEPTSGLDPIVRKELLEIMREYMEQDNKAVFFSSHITTDLDKVADYIVLIDHGKILLAQEKDVLLESHMLAQGQKSELTDDLRAKFIMLEERGFSFEGLTDRPGEVRSLLSRAEYARPSVEDIMVAYTLGGGERS